MSSEALREARRYEEIYEKQISRQDRPGFHLTPRTGWMNDPNGFSWYDNKYHLFYQYNPYSQHWDTMHWGHAVSRDLLRWEYLPAALAPDMIYDQDGCFSGSAVTMDDGKQLIMYTGVRLENRKGRRIEVQTQNIAVGDGLSYEKYEGNPVLTEADLPEGSNRSNFRDPKVWRDKDGTYICAVSAGNMKGGSSILLYFSEDGFHWQFWKPLAVNDGRFGRMWECPDFFPMGNKWVLLTSPQDMLPQGFEYHNGNGTLCLIGSFDSKTGTFSVEHDQSIDYGIDFYAPQTIKSPDGRQIMIGWMQNWDACAIRDDDIFWAGQMSLPRELSVENGRLIQKPIAELKNLYNGKVEYKNVLIDGRTSLKYIKGRRVDMTVTVKPQKKGEVFEHFAIRFAEDNQFYTAVRFYPREEIVQIDRKFSGSRRAIVHQRRAQVSGSGSGEIKLRLILDTYSSEIFINDGIQVMTSTIYTDQSADGISFYADAPAVIDVEMYGIR